MWSGFFKDRDLKMKLGSLLLCWVLAVQNVRAEEGKESDELYKDNPADDSEHTDSQSETTSIQDFSAVQFSLDLYEAVKESQPQNFMLSPLSVRNAVAMLSLGAAGETAEEIRRSLKFPEDENDLMNNQSQLISSLKGISSGISGVKFVTADKIYVNSGLTIKTEYQNDVTEFGGEIENVDFGRSEEAAGKINKWVQEKTEGKIEKIVDSSDLSSQTSLLVLNSIYFKGSWEHKFDNSSTQKKLFFLNGNCSVTVDMMIQENKFQLADLKEAKAQVILLPYKGGRLSMIIYLPYKNKSYSSSSSLDTLENWLKDKSPFDIQSKHLGQPEKVQVSLPKFKIRSSLELNEPLKKLGLAQMFDVGSANFTNLFEDGRNSYVSKVSQETFIEVNEEGTEAAAATGFGLDATSYSQTAEFTADRPFLFQIVDKGTKTVLFSGRVKNPLDSVDSLLLDCGTVETTAAPHLGHKEVSQTIVSDTGKKVEGELRRDQGVETTVGPPTETAPPKKVPAPSTIPPPTKPETLPKDSTPTTTAPPTARPQNVVSPQTSSAWGYAKSGLTVQTFLIQLTAILLLF